MLIASLLLALGSTAPQTPAFERVALETARPRRPVRLSEGVSYRIEDGRLVRYRRRTQREELGCTRPGGSGAVTSFTVQRGGTTFAAAEDGLFCVSAEVDHLDPVPLVDGAPEGRVLNVCATAPNRLWITTDEGFGCIDTVQFFGRTLASADVPAGARIGLVEDRDGGLLLRTDEALWRYEPDRGPGPEVLRVTVDGNTLVPGETIEIDPGGTLEVTAEGTGRGGATFRYRAERHHLWYPFDGSSVRIEGLQPGEHRFLVTAWDQDLRRSAPTLVHVRVPYPDAFDPRVLLPITFVGALGLLLVFLGHARRAGGGRERYARAAVSTGLLVVVALQVLAGIIPHARGWPFVGFTMYTDRYDEDQLTYRMTVYGVLPGGGRVPLQHWGVGYGQMEFERSVLVPLVFGDDAGRHAYLAAQNAPRGGDPFIGFVVQDDRLRLTREGPVHVAPVHMRIHPEDALDAR